MTTLPPGHRIAGYVLGLPLGHGGHATVYRARPATDAPSELVALKVLDEHRSGPAQRARLAREFSFAAQLRHPHVVTVHDAGPDWLAMQLIGGGTVTALPERRDRLTALAQIAAALDHTHRHGVVHCDVKPANILVTPDFARGGAVLIDFGVAYAVTDGVGRHPGAATASLAYAAPELLTGHAPSAATDQYALACTTVELITGAPPFDGHTPADLLDQQLHQQPPRIAGPLDAPHAVDTAVAKALAKDPDHRFDSCAEFVSAISRALR